MNDHLDNEVEQPISKSVQNELRKENRDFAAELSRQLVARESKFGILPVSEKRFETSTGELRRKRRSRVEEDDGIMSLINVDGVLRWQVDSGIAPSRRGAPDRRASAKNAVDRSGEIVEQFYFHDLPANSVSEKLIDLDADLTPQQGLFELDHRTIADLQHNYEVVANASWSTRSRTTRKKQRPVTLKASRPSGNTRKLLFIHGTFSSCENVLQDIYMEDFGQKLIIDAMDQYDQVLAFNHPTVSVSPVMNAAYLAEIMQASKSPIDVVCHSRGGLVTRWWREAFDKMPGRQGHVVFAGSPLQGTSLAAPHRIKAALELLTNISKAISSVSKGVANYFPIAAPYGHASAILFSLFGKALSITARTPVVDAGVALVPGLSAQSRVGTNEEIIRLGSAFDAMGSGSRLPKMLENYSFVLSDFQTEDVGWKFWKAFSKGKIADKAADYLFDAENDLVVDTVSMTALSDSIAWDEIHDDRVWDFGSNDLVHHCNYFRQPETIDFIRSSLRIK